MAEVHQIYCTHCTHGSSALERREGDLAQRMLGYSARAGSLEAAELRRFYRQIERYIYYYLPRDTPAAEKLTLTADTAPRRLFYVPLSGGLQVLGQICYRTTDTQGRPGSYFAHVLWQQCGPGTPRWSPADGLRLWNARGWVQADSDQIPFLLPTLFSPDELLEGRRPAVDDGVLRSFLTAEADAEFDDPARAIPARWRKVPADRRRRALARFLDAVLVQGLGGPEGVLLVAEAELSALWFYAAARLLPVNSLVEGLSFSTFEPNPDRLCTRLAATQFYDPQASDLPPQLYRVPGPAVLNTFLDRYSENCRDPGAYACWVVERLAAEGWPAVEEAVQRLARCQPRSVDDLGRAVEADRALGVLLSGARPPGEAWREPLAAKYLGDAVRHSLSGLSRDRGALERLAGSPAQVPLLALSGSAADDPACRAAVVFLLGALPDAWIGEVCRLDRFTREDKLAMLTRYAAQYARFPPDSDWVWEPRGDEDPLLPDLLARLESTCLERFFGHLEPPRRPEFVLALWTAGGQKRSCQAALDHLLRGLPDDELIGVLQQHREILDDYPADEPGLGERLRKMLLEFPFPLEDFARRLELLSVAPRLLGDERLAGIVEAWQRCRQQLLALGRLQAQGVAWGPIVRRQPPWPQIERTLAEAVQFLSQALPAELLPDDPHGSHKLDRLQQLAARLIGRPLLAPGPWRHEALWQKACWYFADGTWSAVALEQMRPLASKRKTASRRPVLLAAMGLAALVLAWIAWRVAVSPEPVANVEPIDTAGRVERSEPHHPATPPPPQAAPSPADRPPPSAPPEPQPLPAEPAVKTQPAAAGPAVPVARPQPAAAPGAQPLSAGALDLSYEIRTEMVPVEAGSPVKAWLAITLAGPTGQAIPPDSTSTLGFLVRCRLREEEGPGAAALPRNVEGVLEFDTVPIGRSVERVWYHLEFFGSQAALAGGQPRLIGKSQVKRLEPEAGRRYVLRLTLTQAQLDLLKARRPIVSGERF